MPTIQKPSSHLRGVLFFSVLALSSIVSAHSTDTNVDQANKNLPNTPAAWSAAARNDIQIAYQETFDNHPGVYDTQNPDFRKNLQRAKQSGLTLAAKVTNAAGYKAAIERFNVSLQDGHAGAYTNLTEKDLPPMRWPGFVTVWRGDGLYVYASETGGPEAGAKVLSCDGIKTRDLVMKNLFAFRGIASEPGAWWVLPRATFYDVGNPFISLPKRCQFAHEGKTFSKTLTWQLTSEKFNKWRNESYNGDELAVGMTEPRPGLIWVAMPSFQPNEKERDAYRQLTADIEAQRQRYLDSDAIVIDLRHNQGGSSAWSKQFARALWGNDRVNRRLQAFAQKQEVWWRSSKANTAYLAELVDNLKQEKQVEAAAEFGKAQVGMQQALARGDTYYMKTKDADKETALTSEEAKIDRAEDPLAFTKPVYVIVPGQCASACLDALDVFTRFENTKLIGAPSSADSTYMEVRQKKLPSGLATVIIPNKMYVNRPRGAGVFYMPAIPVTDINWSSATFLKVIESDLASKKPR
ncbi:S41 family peptidase [Undibacterium sp. Ji22W]|uniref:S41 family peptidase n=1 Tax=Undibacterium sp. Ji22W TaxID=3413038 RepID=UPI003BF1C249